LSTQVSPSPEKIEQITFGNALILMAKRPKCGWMELLDWKEEKDGVHYVCQRCKFDAL
jgi:hypothetical protein